MCVHRYLLDISLSFGAWHSLRVATNDFTNHILTLTR